MTSTIKSGTGHTMKASIATTSTGAAPDLYNDLAGGSFTNGTAGIGGHLTSNTGLVFQGNTLVNHPAANRYGRKLTFHLGTPTTADCNAEGKVMLIHVRMNGNDGNYSTDTVANSGVLCTLRSTAGNDRSWGIDGRDHSPLTLDYQPVIIDPRYTGTQFGSNGTLNCAAIANIEFHFKNYASGFGYSSQHYGDVYLVTPYVLINGTSGSPGSITDITTSIDSSYLRSCPRASSSIFNPYFSYHIGDGSTATYVSETNRTFIFPSTASGTFAKAHIPAGHIGIQFVGGGASTFLMTGCTTTGPHYFRCNGSAGDTVTLTNTTINNATDVTLSAYTTLVGHTFNSCSMIPLTSSPTITSMSVKNTTAAYAVDCGTNTTIANIAFTALGSSDYAIKISPTATGSFTLTNCTFSGYATGKKIYVNDANAAHTITISGSGITAADTTSAGATIVVPASTTTFTHTGLQAGTRYRIYNATTSTEIANAVTSGSSFSVAVSSGVSTGDTIRVTTTYQSGTTVKWGGPWNGTATVGSTLDFSANTPTTKTEFATWGIDGSTLTELATDYVNVECEITPSGNIDYDRAKFLAFMAYAMTTSSGITNWFGALTINDSANVVINIAMKWLNTLAATTNVRLTSDIYVIRSDGVNLLGNGMNMQTGKVYTISTGSGLSTAQANQLSDLSTNLSSTRTAYIDDIPTIKKIAKNKQKINTATGQMVVYDDDSTTTLLTANVYSDTAGTTPYTGTGGVLVRNKLA